MVANLEVSLKPRAIVPTVKPKRVSNVVKITIVKMLSGRPKKAQTIAIFAKSTKRKVKIKMSRGPHRRLQPYPKEKGRGTQRQSKRTNSRRAIILASMSQR